MRQCAGKAVDLLVRLAAVCRYVYQKAYVEFFCAPDAFHTLRARLEAHASITYMAVQVAGEVIGNGAPGDVNAVTWGVFPGKEVIQPTVVDPKSFGVWKVCHLPLWLGLRSGV